MKVMNRHYKLYKLNDQLNVHLKKPIINKKELKKNSFIHIMYLGTKVKRISHNIFPRGAHSQRGWRERTPPKMLSINATIENLVQKPMRP